jgi:hypothetical protein
MNDIIPDKSKRRDEKNMSNQPKFRLNQVKKLRFSDYVDNKATSLPPVSIFGVCIQI